MKVSEEVIKIVGEREKGQISQEVDSGGGGLLTERSNTHRDSEVQILTSSLIRFH